MICPECGGSSLSTERRPDGDTRCTACGYRDKTEYFSEPKSTDHVVFDSKDQTLKCLHCGESTPIQYGEIKAMMQWSQKWSAPHYNCKAEKV